MASARDLASFEGTKLAAAKVPGLGARSAEKLAQADIVTRADLLGFLPREYLDYTRVTSIGDAPLEEAVHIRGRITSKRASRTPKQRMHILEALVDDGTGTLRVIWFNQPWLNDQVIKDQTASFFGKIRFDKLGRVLNSPKFSAGEEETDGGIEPVYRQVGGLSSTRLANWIATLIKTMPDEECLPAKVLLHTRFPSRGEALAQVHQPRDSAEVVAIRERTALGLRRLIFEEFFGFQQKMRLLVHESQERNHPNFTVENGWLNRFYGQLPFQPTGDQQRVIDTLMADLRQGRRLHALIQGDVGCGKTLIGLAACWLFRQAGWQTALLCPTNILAEQHYQTARSLLEPLGLRTGLLTARLSKTETDEVANALKNGTLDLVIGTHKLFNARFHRLGLALIDEQHRFGVEQRRALLKKGRAPHYLAFSATPIPRSLAMTLYGDYEVIQIHEKPPGRMPVKTILKKVSNRAEIIRFAKQRIALGEAVFWVFPAIEESEGNEEQSARAMHAAFQREAFQEYGVGLVHGKMKKEDVAAEMAAFAAGENQILVATTVIEVGVDIPIASLMVVEEANRFGLSQLHQLRGRVGRSDRAAYCFLVVKDDLGGDGLARMKLLVSCDDGFRIAAKDLEYRGAGDLLGRQQSGVSAFRYGDPWLDRDIMEEAGLLSADFPAET